MSYKKTYIEISMLLGKVPEIIYKETKILELINPMNEMKNAIVWFNSWVNQAEESMTFNIVYLKWSYQGIKKGEKEEKE